MSAQRCHLSVSSIHTFFLGLTDWVFTRRHKHCSRESRCLISVFLGLLVSRIDSGYWLFGLTICISLAVSMRYNSGSTRRGVLYDLTSRNEIGRNTSIQWLVVHWLPQSNGRLKLVSSVHEQSNSQKVTAISHPSLIHELPTSMCSLAQHFMKIHLSVRYTDTARIGVRSESAPSLLRLVLWIYKGWRLRYLSLTMRVRTRLQRWDTRQRFCDTELLKMWFFLAEPYIRWRVICEGMV